MVCHGTIGKLHFSNKTLIMWTETKIWEWKLHWNLMHLNILTFKKIGQESDVAIFGKNLQQEGTSIRCGTVFLFILSIPWQMAYTNTTSWIINWASKARPSLTSLNRDFGVYIYICIYSMAKFEEVNVSPSRTLF